MKMNEYKEEEKKNNYKYAACFPLLILVKKGTLV